MTIKHQIKQTIIGHRTLSFGVLCLFGLCALHAAMAPRKRRPTADTRVYLNHSDELKFDMYGSNPGAQVVKGHVSFTHMGAHLTCDSAYFYQESNSVKAFGHVYFHQGDTLSLRCDRAYYDGQDQMMEARSNVVLRHRRQVLYTDSLNFDRLYSNAYFFEGGRLVDGKDQLVSDWGEYNTETRQATFYYNVRLRSGHDLITTDTLHYDTRHAMAHLVGPSKIVSGTGVVHTVDGYYDTRKAQAQLFGRSTLEDKDKVITGDSLYYIKGGWSTGRGHVVYTDKRNRNSLTCGLMRYNEKTGYGWATHNPVAKEYSQGDTLFVHADSMKIYIFHINTDSAYRKVHAFRKVRAYRTDVQAVCDSLVFNSLDSCLTMYRDPIVWTDNRQLLGEKIQVYMADSSVRMAHVVGQALSVELLPDSTHYNQIASRDMHAYFHNGRLRVAESVGNVQAVFYPTDDKDSSLIGLNYTETDTLRMYMSSERKLERIWMPKAMGTLYPMTQIPPSRTKLPGFAWFDDIRPKSKYDIFVWRGKGDGMELKPIKRHEAPLQHIGASARKGAVQ